MNNLESGPDCVAPRPFRIYKSRRTFLIPETLFLSIILYVTLDGYLSGNISIGLAMSLIGFGIAFVLFIWGLTRSLGFSIGIQHDIILFKYDHKEWKSIPLEDIHTVEFYSLVRNRIMKVTSGPFFQETVFLIGGLKELDEFKSEIRKKLGSKVKETNRWWNKASNFLP